MRLQRQAGLLERPLKRPGFARPKVASTIEEAFQFACHRRNRFRSTCMIFYFQMKTTSLTLVQQVRHQCMPKHSSSGPMQMASPGLRLHRRIQMMPKNSSHVRRIHMMPKNSSRLTGIQMIPKSSSRGRMTIRSPGSRLQRRLSASIVLLVLQFDAWSSNSNRYLDVDASQSAS